MSLNENLQQGENWKTYCGYLLPPKHKTKAAFFLGKSFWLLEKLNWEDPWKLFPWRAGGFNSAKLPQALPASVARLQKQRSAMKWCMWFTTLLPWVTLRHGPSKSERNWGARGTSSSRNSSPANNYCLFKRSVLNHTACCSGRINAIAQSVGEICATHPTSLLRGVAQPEPGKTQGPPPHGHTKRAWLP